MKVMLASVPNLEIYKFPKDLEIAKLAAFGLAFKIEYRIEFDKCMAEDSLVEKLKKMDEDEILEFLKIRADFYKEENQAELDKAKKDKEDLEFRKEQKNKATPLSEDDKKNIAEAQAKYKTEKEARVIKTKKDPMTDLRKKHELEKEKHAALE